MIPFWKVEAVGNGFVLVHASDVVGVDLACLARSVCEPRFGVGADGLLVVSPDLALRMFNPDGTEDFCGNGLRCAAWHIVGQGWAEGSFVIRHHGIDVAACVHLDGMVEVTQLPASFDPLLVPLDLGLHSGELWMEERWGGLASSVSTGTTHTVILVESLPSDEVFFSLSPQIENDPLFPDRTSVMWTQVVEPGRLKLRIWERGAGATQGCGTGSSAAAVVYARSTGHRGRIEVENPGGTVLITLPKWDAPITMASVTSVIFPGSWAVK